MRSLIPVLGMAALWVTATSVHGDSDPNPILSGHTLYNQAAYIPPQCYTDTRDDAGRVHNPCSTCHIESRAPNYINDADIQRAYAFPRFALNNHWSNLFVDRSRKVEAISDAAISDYVRVDNYRDATGKIRLAERLAQLPSGWDQDGNGQWDGFVPDAWFNFDEEGFDRAPDGSYSGWRALAYYPFLGTFWPTNGSTDDVLIRLADTFRSDEAGEPDIQVYKLNLAIVEALIKRRDIRIEVVDENLYGVDLDKDGTLGQADRIVYDWAPLKGRTMSYVGQARLQLQNGAVHLAAGLFPEGTEFLHSVRYIDLGEAQQIRLAPRMKELRYGRKVSWRSYSDLKQAALEEVKEEHDFPDRLRQLIGDMERGVSNDQGWVYQAFIEDARGELRPQTYEETVFCIGCHSGVGATTDGIFSFPRKLGAQAFQRGWYHWTQKGIDGLPDPLRTDGHHEYTYYLQNNGAGDEFRENDEVLARFFNPDGSLKPEMRAALQRNIAVLLNPSPQRALSLNKAYRVIVEAQSFIDGRDATIAPVVNVHNKVKQDQPTGVEEPVSGPGVLGGTWP
jgi:hypothetical protein